MSVILNNFLQYFLHQALWSCLKREILSIRNISSQIYKAK